MSRKITGAVLFFLLAAICTFSMIGTKHITDELKTDMKIIKESDELRNDTIKTIIKKWDKYSKYASVYLNHQDLERLSIIIATLDSVDENRCEYIDTSCDEALEILEHIWMSELPALYNIF